MLTGIKRASAAFEFAMTVPQTMSIAVGATLIALLDYRLMLGIVATAVTVSAVYLATRPGQRPGATEQSADVLVPAGGAVAAPTADR
ncbi:hypothetical protein [Micromonospora sp. LOL_024]|uniref:hypothetical protein n=1 Tax=Micromonospora sp. LOL_024 TaxID=3345412 RepID=UPI003A839468